MQIIRILMLGAGMSVRGGITSVEKLILENVPSDLQVQHVSTFAKGTAVYNIKVLLNAVRILTLSLLNNSTDLIHIHFSERGSTLRKFILVLIVLIFRKPFVLHSHGAAYKEFYAGLPTLLQNLIANVFRRCNKFIALSENWKSYYLDIFSMKSDQVVVLYNPVKLPAQIPNRADRQQVTFVFLGRIGERRGALDIAAANLAKQDKGAFDLIKAFSALPDAERLQARLVLAGNGDVEAAQQLANQLGVDHQITIHNWLEPFQRDQLLADSDVFVLPSYNEGLPMSMLEAMAWGLPVIVTPVGGIPEVITHEEQGFLVQPGNPTELSTAMQRMIQNDQLRLKLGRAARDRAQDFNVSNYIQSLHELYSSVVNVSGSNALSTKYSAQSHNS